MFVYIPLFICYAKANRGGDLLEKCQEHSAHTEKLNNIEKQLGCFTQIAEKVTIVEQSIKVAHKRIDDVHEQTAAIIEMGTSIRMMAKQVQDMLEMLKNHQNRIEVLERLPGETLKGYWKVFLFAILGALGGAAGMFLLRGGW